MSVVLDASAVVDFLLGGVPENVAPLLAGDAVAPDLLYPEVARSLARIHRRGLIDRARLDELVDVLLALPIDAIPTRGLIVEALVFCDRVSPYDGCYLALAASKGAPLITADRKLARAHDLPVEFIVL